MSGLKPAGSLKLRQTTKASAKEQQAASQTSSVVYGSIGRNLRAPMDVLRELRGLEHVTFSKKQPSWSYRSDTSLPRKILATKVPPGFKICSVMPSAYEHEPDEAI